VDLRLIPKVKTNFQFDLPTASKFIHGYIDLVRFRGVGLRRLLVVVIPFAAE
jgi:hypothetical protein